MRTHRHALLAPLRVAAVAALACSAPRLAHARPGTHAPAVNTWDTRASSVTPGATIGSVDGGGHFNYYTYGANFSASTGNLSAQFSLSYVDVGLPVQSQTFYGASGGAVAVFSFPLTSRYENGVPKVALGPYAGAVPTAIVSESLNYLSFPAVFGLGMPLSPAKWLTFTPWGEVAVSYDIDGKPTTDNVLNDPLVQQYQNAAATAQQTGKIPDLPPITSDVAARLARESVSLDYSTHVSFRGGAQLMIHLDDDLSLQGNFMAWKIGGFEGSSTVLGGGGAIVWRWDDIVPAVLPAETRLLRESCEAVADRFRLCPQYRELLEGPKSTAPTAPLAPANQPRDEQLHAPPPSSASPAAPPATPAASPPPATTTTTPVAPEPAAPPGTLPAMPGMAPPPPPPPPQR